MESSKVGKAEEPEVIVVRKLDKIETTHTSPPPPS
jgi:hypothetical protein